MKNEKFARPDKCLCPYCDEELLVTSSTSCKACGVAFRRCVKCGVTVLDRKAGSCPKCGEPLT